MRTYDIINAGPNNRFTANGRVVSNSGRHIQIQNLPQNHISTLDEARELVKMGELQMLESIYGNVPDILSQLIRTMLVPKEGCEFIVADFSAIEARVLAWLAGEEWVLDAFLKGQDLYCTVASQMFHVPVVKNGINGELRQKGKIATLACGYQGGVGALISMGALSMSLKETELPDIINSWREANPKIVQFWWDMEKAAVDTVKTHEEHSAGRIRFQYYSGTLWMVLPSGRKLAYLKPKLQPNRFGRMSLTFEGVGNAAGSGGWSRQETYGGKLVENCVAEGTLVLTDRGLVSIENIREDDLIWDGVEWVSHEGLIDKGIQNTVSVGGIRFTPDHKILTEEGWRKCVEADRFNWADVSLPYGSGTDRKYKRRESTMVVPVHLREENCGGSVGFKEETIPNKVMRMHERKIDIQSEIHAWDDSSSGIWCVAFHEAKMHGSESSGLLQLRRTWYNGLPGVGRKLRKILGRYGTNLSERTGTGSYQQRRRLLSWKLPMGKQEDQLQEQEVQPAGRFSLWENNSVRAFRKNRYWCNNAPLQAGSQLADRITVHPTGLKEQVYDIRNCGPRHRFAVYDPEAGKLRIVSNCTQATARDILTEAMWRLEQAGFEIVGHVHDEVIIEAPAGQHTVEGVCSIMAQNPDWCPDCPLAAAGYLAPNYYFKD